MICYQDEIQKMGLEINEFGGGSYVVKSIPAILGHLAIEEVVAGIFELYHEAKDNAGQATARIENILATMACKAAVKANHPLKDEEIRELLKKMRESSAFSHCPHGRPVIKQFTETDIKKWFRRT